MGFLDKLFGRKVVEQAPEPRRASAPKTETGTRPCTQDDFRRINAQNKEFLAANGVDVDQFTSKKVKAEALSVLHDICGPMAAFDNGLDAERPRIAYASPTKTGKIPKNVASGYLSNELVERKSCGVEGYDIERTLCSLTIGLDYLADGRINKAEVRGFYEGTFVTLSVRRSGDALRITSAGFQSVRDGGVWQSLCMAQDATDDDFRAALDAYLPHLFA